jgi:hypothetical protein
VSEGDDLRDWRATAERFATAAERYETWLTDRTKPLSAQDALMHLVDLFAAAIALLDPPASELQHIADEERVSDAEWKAVFARGGELPFQYYRVVLNPHELDAEVECGIGDLSDDLADVHRDLVGPLRLYRTGDVASAVWHWRFGYRHHWGEHATEAIQALHRHENA